MDLIIQKFTVNVVIFAGGGGGGGAANFAKMLDR